MQLISIITPVLNEEDMITPFLDDIAGLSGSFELIVVDGGSTDSTCAVVRDYTGRFPARLHLLSTEAGRSFQMNTGAQTAEGEILLFLHVDCRIPADSLEVIARACSEPGICGGAFSHTFGEPGFFHAVIGILVRTCTKYTRTFFGDSGIFVKRDIFFKAGEFPIIPWCEDLEFCRSVRNYCRMMQIDRVIRSSPRRFHRVGRVKLTAVYLLAIVLNFFKIRPLFLKRFIIDR
jgi:rSAM/selenodomain-associated transferase 2